MLLFLQQKASSLLFSAYGAFGFLVFFLLLPLFFGGGVIE